MTAWSLDIFRGCAKDSPPWRRRGGRAIKKNGPKAPCLARTGWFVQATLRIYSAVERTTPVYAQLRARAKINLAESAALNPTLGEICERLCRQVGEHSWAEWRVWF